MEKFTALTLTLKAKTIILEAVSKALTSDVVDTIASWDPDAGWNMVAPHLLSRRWKNHEVDVVVYDEDNTVHLAGEILLKGKRIDSNHWSFTFPPEQSRHTFALEIMGELDKWIAEILSA